MAYEDGRFEPSLAGFSEQQSDELPFEDAAMDLEILEEAFGKEEDGYWPLDEDAPPFHPSELDGQQFASLEDEIEQRLQHASSWRTILSQRVAAKQPLSEWDIAAINVGIRDEFERRVNDQYLKDFVEDDAKEPDDYSDIYEAVYDLAHVNWDEMPSEVTGKESILGGKREQNRHYQLISNETLVFLGSGYEEYSTARNMDAIRSVVEQQRAEAENRRATERAKENWEPVFVDYSKAVTEPQVEAVPEKQAETKQPLTHGEVRAREQAADDSKTALFSDDTEYGTQSHSGEYQ